MKALNDWLKLKIKKFLLFLIKQLDEPVPIAPKIRLSGNNFFNKELNIPVPLTIIVLFVCVYFMLSMQVAISNKQMLGLFVLLAAIFSLVIFYFKYEAKLLFKLFLCFQEKKLF